MCKRWGGKGNILGEYVCGFNARDEDQDQISPPPWSLIWKEAATRTTVGIYFLPSTTLRESWGGELQRREQDQEVPCLWASEISCQRGWDCELRLMWRVRSTTTDRGELWMLWWSTRVKDGGGPCPEIRVEDGGLMSDWWRTSVRVGRECSKGQPERLWKEERTRSAMDSWYMSWAHGARHEGRKWPKGELFWRSSGLHRWRQGRPQERMGRNECRKFSIRTLLASLMFVVIWQAEVWRSLQRRWFRWKNTSWLTERTEKAAKERAKRKSELCPRRASRSIILSSNASTKRGS